MGRGKKIKYIFSETTLEHCGGHCISEKLVSELGGRRRWSVQMMKNEHRSEFYDSKRTYSVTVNGEARAKA